MSEWISIDERMPEPGEFVIAWADTPLLRMLDHGKHDHIIVRQLLTQDGQRWADEGVTHWMKLPPPPERYGEQE